MSATVQALPTCEIIVCENVNSEVSTNNKDFIYTIDVKFNEDLKPKNKEVSIRSRKDKIRNYTVY